MRCLSSLARFWVGLPHIFEDSLENAPSLAVQRLLLSATNLVYLSLRFILDSSRNSPEDMAACLSGLTRLESLILQHPLSQRFSRVSRQLLPPLTPSVLPALTQLEFQGHTRYLERLVARLDAPLLLDLYIAFIQNDVLDVPQLRRFINRAEKLGTHARATMSYSIKEHRLPLSSQP